MNLNKSRNRSTSANIQGFAVSERPTRIRHGGERNRTGTLLWSCRKVNSFFRRPLALPNTTQN